MTIFILILSIYVKAIYRIELKSGFLYSWFCVETVKAKLAQQYPNVKINNLQTTEMQGLYSGTLDNQIVYVNEDASIYLLVQ
jgi:thiol:disulfide interchange protein DsbC